MGIGWEGRGREERGGEGGRGRKGRGRGGVRAPGRKFMDPPVETLQR